LGCLNNTIFVQVYLFYTFSHFASASYVSFVGSPGRAGPQTTYIKNEKNHIQNLHLYTIFRNLPLEKPKKYAIVAARFGFHESPRMLCPLQAHSRELIVNPKPPFVYWFQEWIEVDPKEHGER